MGQAALIFVFWGEGDGLVSHLLLQPGLQLGDGQTHLLHGVAVTDSDAVVVRPRKLHHKGRFPRLQRLFS